MAIYADCAAALTFSQGRILVLGRPQAAPLGLIAVARSRLVPGEGGRLLEVRAESVDNAERAALDGIRRPDQAGQWHAFLCRFEGGRRDVLYASVPQGRALCDVRQAFQVIWPLLRHATLPVRPAPVAPGEEALNWAMSHKSDLATLVVGPDRTLVVANAAAQDIIASARLLRRGPDGRIEAVAESGKLPFRRALRKCATCTNPEGAAATLILEESAAPEGAGACRTTAFGDGIPVSVTRYFREGAPTDYLVITVPRPPDSGRIAELARMRGLTPTESRIAELLHQGLSNREVALATGLSEETVKTYSKRVLGKLNVTRSGLAHLLTWQAGGGRVA